MSISYESRNAAVATVKNDGEISATGVGQTFIKISIKPDGGETKELFIKVLVVPDDKTVTKKFITYPSVDVGHEFTVATCVTSRYEFHYRSTFLQLAVFESLADSFLQRDRKSVV